MNSLFPVLFIMWPVMSFRAVFYRAISALRSNPAESPKEKSWQYNHSLSQLQEFNKRMILGVVDSMTAEIVGGIPPDSMFNMVVDDFVATVPHNVVSDIMENSGDDTGIKNQSVNYKLILVPVNTTIVIQDGSVHTSIGGVYFDHSVPGNTKINTKDRRGALNVVFRYLLPPIAFQVLPHIIVQIVSHFAHEHLQYVEHLAHFFDFGI